MSQRTAKRRARGLLAGLCAGVVALGAAAPAQAAFDDPLFVFKPSQLEPVPPISDFEGPCGVGVDSVGNLYVSDYYHHVIDVFKPSPSYIVQLKKVDPLDGPCGLALNPAGDLYVNNYHRNVEKLVPSSFPPTAGSTFPVFIPATTYTSAGIVDSSHPTGVAVDPATSNVYVDARTYIAIYDSAGAPLGHIGEGSIEDGYGVALSSFPGTLGYLYVPDAATKTVKVFDPATDVDDPIEVIDGSDVPVGGFGSLRDAAIAVDSTTGEIYVADTLGPQFSEEPKATIQVFDSAGAYEGQLKHQVIDGMPVGLAVDNSPTATQGRVYVTSGNTEEAEVYVYPPGAATDPPPAPLGVAPGGGSGETSSTQAGSSDRIQSAEAKGPSATPSAIAQKGNLRVSVNGALAPKALPRKGAAPISVSVGGEVSTTDQSLPPQLKSLQIELNRNGKIETEGLPTCPYDRIQPASTQRALSACRSALVGQGSFTANITLAGQEPYPTKGKLLVFNAKEKGKPVLYGQIYSPRPFATSFVIVFKVKKQGKGPYGTTLSAFLPNALGTWGNLTGIEMTLQRRYSYKGRSRSYISAGCPAPKGLGAVPFSLARATFGFEGGRELSSVLSGTCRVKDGTS